MAGLFNVGDFMPSIAWMDLQGIREGGRKKLHKKFGVLIAKMIEQRAATKHHCEGKPGFLHVVMANSEDPNGERLTTTNIKAFLLGSKFNLSVIGFIHGRDRYIVEHLRVGDCGDAEETDDLRVEWVISRGRLLAGIRHPKAPLPPGHLQ